MSARARGPDTAFQNSASVTLYGPEKHVDTYALVDDGSALTLLDDELSTQLLAATTTRVGNCFQTGLLWRSDDPRLDVLDELGGTNEHDNGVNLELDYNATEKILGLRWCTVADSFVFGMRIDRVDGDIIKGIKRPTKRELLSALTCSTPLALLQTISSTDGRRGAVRSAA